LQPAKSPQIDERLCEENPNPAEVSLLAAILERAISDILGAVMPCFGNRQNVIRDAEKWLLSSSLESIDAEPFTYAWICEHLCICPRKLRVQLINDLKRGRKYTRDGLWRRSAKERWFSIAHGNH